MLGYAVLTSGGGRGTIADLLARPGRTDVVESVQRCAPPLGFIASRRDIAFSYLHVQLSPDDLASSRLRTLAST